VDFSSAYLDLPAASEWRGRVQQNQDYGQSGQRREQEIFFGTNPLICFGINESLAKIAGKRTHSEGSGWGLM
jgi:hypothetical protein